MHPGLPSNPNPSAKDGERETDTSRVGKLILRDHSRISEVALVFTRFFTATAAAITAEPNFQNGCWSAFTLHQTPILYAEEAKQMDLPHPTPTATPRGR